MSDGRAGDGQAADRNGHPLFTSWPRLVVALACLLAVAICVSQLITLADRIGIMGPARVGRPGASYHASSVAPGWFEIDRVDPGGPADRAGITPGSSIRFDNAIVIGSDPAPGAHVGVIIRPAGPGSHRLRHTSMQYAAMPPRTPRADWFALSLAVLGGGAFALLLGVAVIWRGWGNPAALALGLGLIGFLAGTNVPWWAAGSALAPAFQTGVVLVNLCSLGLLIFPMLLYDQAVAKVFRSTWLWMSALIALAALNMMFVVINEWKQFPLANAAASHGLAIANTIVLATGPAIAGYWAWRGMRDGLGAERNRFAVVLMADALIVISVLLVLLGDDNLAVLGGAAQIIANTASTLLASVAFPLVLTYAVLRYRVVDLGFVFNRTLVFGSVSALLLGCFGLIEWGIEHWLPESWVKDSAWIDAGAALLVYLVFHRVHTAVEHRVEHVFFHRWHSNEAILRRFVASAPHFEDERALARAFADEVSRFGGEALVALYRRKERTHDAILERMAGSWDTAPRTLPVDDPAFALMRAERSALDLADALTDLPGVLALPMLDHGTLAGLVLMDLKGNGALYRPDEIAVLGWAAHDVALAMAALHAGLIESENRLLKAQLARLGSLIGDRMDHAGA